MADGATHDRVGLIASGLLCLGGFINPSLATETFLIGLGCAAGTLYLSPDLDGYPWNSECQQRWMQISLGFIWSIYRRAIKHRSIWSHFPILGTTIRLVYLFFAFSPLLAILDSVGLMELEFINSSYSLLVLVGIELSAIVHYLLDGLFIKWAIKLYKSSIKKLQKLTKQHLLY